jgi:uncharacterized protein YihD (DUF1040 family)
MRDPERIDRIVALLADLWHREPDWRLGQLVVNVAGSDPFSMEDDEAEDLLRLEIDHRPLQEAST